MKKVSIALAILLLCCCISTVGGFALFGRVELDNECKYFGPLATETDICKKEPEKTESKDDTDDKVATEEDKKEEVKAPATIDLGNKYNGADFYLSYPDGFTLSEDTGSNSVYIFKGSTLQGDNLSVLKYKFPIKVGVLGDSFCEEYGNSLTQSLSGQGYTNVKKTNSGLYSVNEYDACMVSYSGTLSNTNVWQTQYFLLDNDDDKAGYYITVTTTSSSAHFDFDEIIDTFKIN
jgi:hypothetical protein